VSTIVTQHHCAEENSTPHLHVDQPLAAPHKEPKDPYLLDHMCEVVKDTSERDCLWDTLNLGEDPSDFDKCTFDLSVELLLTSTGSRNDGSPMTLPSTNLFPTQAPSCDNDKPLHSSGALTILKSLTGYQYGDLLSWLSLVYSHVTMFEDIEEEITFYCSDGNRDDDEDILMVIEPCAPFGIQLFPHHDNIFPQAPCDVVYHGDFSHGEPYL